MKRKHSDLDALIITHRNNELKLLQAKVELRDSPRLESEKTRKVECERQKLNIKPQEMEGEHWAVMTEIESQLCEEEKESALIKEGEDDIWKVKREHEGKEGKLQTAMTDIESQLHEKEGYEGVSIKERDKENCRIKHEHEERAVQLQAAMTKLESQLREKGKGEKRVRVESAEANEKIGRMKRDNELKLKEAKKRVGALESKLRRVSALLGAESDQKSEVGLKTMSGETGHRASMNKINSHNQVGEDPMDFNND